MFNQAKGASSCSCSKKKPFSAKLQLNSRSLAEANGSELATWPNWCAQLNKHKKKKQPRRSKKQHKRQSNDCHINLWAAAAKSLKAVWKARAASQLQSESDREGESAREREGSAGGQSIGDKELHNQEKERKTRFAHVTPSLHLPLSPSLPLLLAVVCPVPWLASWLNLANSSAAKRALTVVQVPSTLPVAWPGTDCLILAHRHTKMATFMQNSASATMGHASCNEANMLAWHYIDERIYMVTGL